MVSTKLSTDLRLISLPKLTEEMPETKIKIGLTRGLVDGGDIFAQFNLSSKAQFSHVYSYISAVCQGEHVLAIYWYSRQDREFILIHDNRSLDLCLAHSGLHEILYIISEIPNKHAGYNSSYVPKNNEILMEPIQLKTSSPSSGPSPDTGNLDPNSSEEETKPLRKKAASLEWSYELDNPMSVQDPSSAPISRDESAFDMTQRGERPTYYPYLEHYHPPYPPTSHPLQTPHPIPPTHPTRPKAQRKRETKQQQPRKYSSASDEQLSMSDDSGSDSEDPDKKEEEAELYPPPKRKKKAKRRANRAALEQRRTEVQMESFKEFATTVTADYLAEMFSKASHGRRLIWIAVWLASFVYAWYNIALSIGVFLSKPTATKLNFYEAPRDGVPFPTVTLCNFNKYNKSFFTDGDLMKDQLSKFLKKTTPIWGHKEELSDVDWDTKYSRIKKMNMFTLLESATQTAEDTVQYCRFGGKPCADNTGQPSEDPTAGFQRVYTEHGLCYTFNKLGNLNMTRTGALYGLSLRLHVGQDDYFETQDVAGFKVLLHNSYEPPMIEEYGFALRPGSETYVRIRLSKFKDTKRPLGYCDPSLEAQFGGGYTISKCIMQYRKNNTVAKCKCRAFYMDGTEKVCNLYEEWNCVEPLLEDMALGNLVIDGKKIPDPDCPSPCVYTTYTYTISQSEYPSVSVKDTLIKQVNAEKGIDQDYKIEDFRNNYLKVHIYFEELSTLEMERHPSYLISNLIGDVGGQLGLLLGMNICSLVQFSDYIIRFSFFKGLMGLVQYYKDRNIRHKR